MFVNSKDFSASLHADFADTQAGVYFSNLKASAAHFDIKEGTILWLRESHPRAHASLFDTGYEWAGPDTAGKSMGRLTCFVELRGERPGVTAWTWDASKSVIVGERFFEPLESLTWDGVDTTSLGLALARAIDHIEKIKADQELGETDFASGRKGSTIASSQPLDIDLSTLAWIESTQGEPTTADTSLNSK